MTTARVGQKTPDFEAPAYYQIYSKGLGTIGPYIQDNRARNYTQAGRRPRRPSLSGVVVTVWCVGDWRLTNRARIAGRSSPR